MSAPDLMFADDKTWPTELYEGQEMRTDYLELLKRQPSEPLTIHCLDGEILTVRVIFVSEQNGCVDYDLIATSMPERYKSRAPDEAYETPLTDIVRVELAPPKSTDRQ